jgi:sigma-54 dependent transcriptional regulator, acetoin dehydrogenase operon transcriptional activator AcoR
MASREIVSCEKTTSGPGGGVAIDDRKSVEQSWKRCQEQYKLDPNQKRKYNVLTRAEVAELHGPIEGALRLIGDDIDYLDSLVGEVGYDSSFADPSGVVVERHAKNYEAMGHNRYVEPVGSIWREDIEGTNAVGTCAAEGAPVAIWKEDHFLRQYGGMSCAAAPVKNPAGKTVGILNITGAKRSISKELHQVCFKIVKNLARRAERNLFRDHHRTSWMMGLRLQDLDVGLLAVDEEYRIVGLDYVARRFLNVAHKFQEGGSLWQFFEKDASILTPARVEVEQVTLTKVSTRSQVTARIRSPIDARPSGRVVYHGRSNRPTTTSMLDRPASLSLSDCAGSDPYMCENVELLRRTIDTPLSILLAGETGTGKDVLARAIHAESVRAKKAFVPINCAAIPESLIESELFGYGTGAFTGARRDGSAGRVAEGDGGTLFLDEIGDMPLALQTRLLRFLETGEVVPLGGGRTRYIDTQVIAATNRNIQEALSSGQFRTDLYHRLAGMVFHLPALRERRDLDELILKVLRVEARGQPVDIDQSALAVLRAYSWPGNIRELRNVLRRAVVLAAGASILPWHIRLDSLVRASAVADPLRSPAIVEDLLEEKSPAPCTDARGAAALAERTAIVEALKQHSGDVNLCSKVLGISRATLYRKIRRYDLK